MNVLFGVLITAFVGFILVKTIIGILHGRVDSERIVLFLVFAIVSVPVVIGLNNLSEQENENSITSSESVFGTQLTDEIIEITELAITIIIGLIVLIAVIRALLHIAIANKENSAKAHPVTHMRKVRATVLGDLNKALSVLKEQDKQDVVRSILNRSTDLFEDAYKDTRSEVAVFARHDLPLISNLILEYARLQSDKGTESLDKIWERIKTYDSTIALMADEIRRDKITELEIETDVIDTRQSG